MSLPCPQSESSWNLEAPGDLLSGLLGICELQSESLSAGDIRTFPAAPGQWRLLTPLSGSLDLAWADRTWTLAAHQAAAFPGGEGLSLLAREDAAFLCLALCGIAAERVLEQCRREGGLFFASGGLAMESMLHSLNAHAGRSVSASEASAAAYVPAEAYRESPADGKVVLLAANLTDREQRVVYRVYGTDKTAVLVLAPYGLVRIKGA